jgi:hypothetical protein
VLQTAQGCTCNCTSLWVVVGLMAFAGVESLTRLRNDGGPQGVLLATAHGSLAASLEAMGRQGEAVTHARTAIGVLQVRA